MICLYMFISFSFSSKNSTRTSILFFFNDTATTEIYTLSLHDALPIWGHEALLQVERILRIRHRVHGATQEEALAPERGVLAGLDAHRHVARVEVREDERVEDLARRSLRVALRIGAQRACDRKAIAQRVRRRGVGVVEAAVRAVDPSGRAHARAEASLPHEVEFGQDVHPVGDEGVLGEVAVAVVEVGIAEDLRILVLDTNAGVVAHGVVPTHREVGIGESDLEGAGLT